MKLVLIGFVALGITGKAQIITTIAGGGTIPPSPATTVPWLADRIARDAAGNIYGVSERLNQVFKYSVSGTVSVFAGRAQAGFAGDGGPATSALLSSPRDIAVDGTGNVYIVDALNCRIRKVSPSGIISTATQRCSRVMTSDSTGNVYFDSQEYDNNGVSRTRILRMDTTGNLSDAFPSFQGHVGDLQSLTVDQAGGVYFVRFGSDQIFRIDPSGAVTPLPLLASVRPAWLSAQGQTLYIGGLDRTSFDSRCVLYKATGANITILNDGAAGLEFNGDGLTLASTGMCANHGVADSAGNLYVSDGRLRKIDASLIVRTIAGNGDSYYGIGGPATSAQVGAVYGVAADLNGNVYFADGISRVNKIDTNGILTTVAGTAERGYTGDGGPANRACLTRPEGVAVDAQGNVFIADTENYRVRKVDTQGIITTYAGNGTRPFGFGAPLGDGGPATAAIVRPVTLAFDPAGRLVIQEGGRIRRVDAGGIITTVATVSDGFNLAVDGGGAIYVSDVYAGVIKRIDPSGSITIVAGGGTVYPPGEGVRATSVRLSPTHFGMATDVNGNLYFDNNDGTLRRMTPAGILTTFAGKGFGGVISGDGGLATEAFLGMTGGLAVDRLGNLYLSDLFNGRIRMVNNGTIPAVKVFTPASANAGTIAFSLEVTGINFTPQSVVRWNGAARPTTFVSATVLRAQIAASDVAAVGTASVSVLDPVSGSYNSVPFTITAPPPAAPSQPTPVDLAAGVSTTASLSWVSSGATSYDVYFGSAANPPQVGTVNSASFSPGVLAAGSTYYWRVVARNTGGTATSPVWRFTTAAPVSVGGLRFLPITPCRAADTRSGQGTTGNFGPPTLNANTTRELPMFSSRCNIPATAQAYSLNVTAVPHEPLGYLTLWPAGQAQPLVSTLNSFHGGIVANAAIVPAGTGGAIRLFVTNKADVIVDINGYFEAAAGLSFYALDPCRSADTRGNGGAVTGARTFPLPSLGCCVPGSAGAYSLNVTAVPVGGLGYLTAWPAGQTQPFVSTLNSPDGSVVANAAMVPAGTGGAVNVFVTDPADTILDINGYFAAAGAAGELRFRPLVPCRAVDTREASGAPALAGGAKRDFTIAGKCGVPAAAKALSMNVTVVPNGPLGYLSLWPAGKPQPLVSTLNSFQGRVVANAALTPLGANGAVSVFVTNQTHVILDVNGYFD